MTTAIWLIAVCEIVRAIQNSIQIMTIRHDTKGRDTAYAEFVKSLKKSDKEFVRRMLEEFERQEENNECTDKRHGDARNM